MPSKMKTTSVDLRISVAFLSWGNAALGMRGRGIFGSLPLVPLGAYHDQTARPGSLKAETQTSAAEVRPSLRLVTYALPETSMTPDGQRSTLSSPRGVVALR